MRTLHLGLRPPDPGLNAVHAAIRECDGVEAARLLSGGVADEPTATHVFAVEGDADALAAALASRPAVRDHEVVPLDEGGCYAYTRAETADLERRLRRALVRGTAVVSLPVALRADGSVGVRLVGPGPDLERAMEAVPAAVGVTVERVGDYDASPDGVAAALTDRQREALAAGLAVGYYAVPRRGSHEDVAERLDCAPSTASEHLRKAEAALVRAALGDRDGR